eukprot:Rmarinus@m.27648
MDIAGERPNSEAPAPRCFPDEVAHGDGGTSEPRGSQIPCVSKLRWTPQDKRHSRGHGMVKIAELHGNTHLEYCKLCHTKYMRRFRTRNNPHVHQHGTGRFCENSGCRGELQDSIINFGENLPETELHNGTMHHKMADVCVVFGSSLRVTPAADLPAMVAERRKDLVIVNLQKTPLDKYASLRIFAKSDDVFEMLMAKLGYPIPDYCYQRDVTVVATVTPVRQAPSAKPSYAVEARLTGSDGISCNFVRHAAVRVQCAGSSGLSEGQATAAMEPGWSPDLTRTQIKNMKHPDALVGKVAVSGRPVLINVVIKCHTGSPDEESCKEKLKAVQELCLSTTLPVPQAECAGGAVAVRTRHAVHLVRNDWSVVESTPPELISLGKKRRESVVSVPPGAGATLKQPQGNRRTH